MKLMKLRDRSLTAALLAASLAVGLSACASASPPAAATPPATAMPAAASVDHPDDPVMTEGRRWTAAFYGGQTGDLWNQFDDGMRKLLKSKDGLDAFRSDALSQLGSETKILDEHVKRDDGVASYVRTAQFDKVGRPIVVSFAFGADGRIAGFFVGPKDSASRDAIDGDPRVAYASR
jgi:hypothetical protein